VIPQEFGGDIGMAAAGGFACVEIAGAAVGKS
jgi:hypothetical protein